MVREGRYKLIFLANGGHRMLFDVVADPEELHPVQDVHPHVVECLTDALVAELVAEGRTDAVRTGPDRGVALRTQPYETWERHRIYQFDRSRGVIGFPPSPTQVHYEPA